MYKIYHNARCKKSRAGLDYLKGKTNNIEVREYLKVPLTKEELNDILSKTGLKVSDLIRTQEDYYKKEIKGKGLDDEKLFQEIIGNPKLLQRPIVLINNQGVLAQPPEKIDEII